jgi:hypothetical protein
MHGRSSFSDGAPNLLDRGTSLARRGAFFSLMDDLLLSLRGSSGQEVETAYGNSKFRNLRNLPCEHVQAHEAFGCVFAPSKFSLQPGQPIAVAGDRFAFGQPPSDLDDVTDGAFA